jgi:hypothetical protein
MTQQPHHQVHEEVRERYAQSALQVQAKGEAACCGEQGIGAELYSALERDELPDAALLASLGCGNPTAVADPIRVSGCSTWDRAAGSTSC